MTQIPEDFIERASSIRMKRIFVRLTEFEGKSRFDKDSSVIANRVVNELIPAFEEIRVEAKKQLDSGELTKITSNAYHLTLAEIEKEAKAGNHIAIRHLSYEAQDAWHRAVQYSAFVHGISFVRSGNEADVLEENTHGGKTHWPP